MSIKRGNNEGTVHKLPNGHWRGQVSHDGHRRSKTFPTQRDCIDWVRKNRNQISDGMSYTSTQLTINEYMDRWLTNAKTTKRQSTWIHYDQLTRHYINPSIGNIKLKDIRAEHIQGLYNHLLKIGVGIHTIRKLHAVLHSALNQAVKQAVIIQNPASLVDPPRKPVREMVILTESQASQLLVAAKSHRLEALFHLAITAGLRESELLGLKWIDLDWIKRTLKIERQLDRPHGEGFQFSPPKTAFGKRSIKLGNKSIEILRKHFQNQQGERVAAGDVWKEYDLIFPTSVGTPIHQSQLIRSFKLLLKHAGLPPIRFHDLRHTSASLMLNHDIPVIIVSRRLGHARASITSDVYGHLLPNMQDEAAEMIDDLVTPTEVKLKEPISVV
jgi:integrase